MVALPAPTGVADEMARQWAQIAAPGTWLSGAERVAVATATRRAMGRTTAAAGLPAELTEAVETLAIAPATIDGPREPVGGDPSRESPVGVDHDGGCRVASTGWPPRWASRFPSICGIDARHSGDRQSPRWVAVACAQGDGERYES